jgi:hypothetical protein
MPIDRIGGEGPRFPIYGLPFFRRIRGAPRGVDYLWINFGAAGCENRVIQIVFYDFCVGCVGCVDGGFLRHRKDRIF